MVNKEFEKIIDTTEEWITTRTGIRERHIVPLNEHIPASELGVKAASKALEKAGCQPSEIDGLICATFTPDSFFPSTACRMQATLGCQNAFAIDVSAACAGFVYALSIANSFIKCGQCKKILVVGTEVISKTLDWSDRSTCILFGDGAGAVLVEVTDNKDCGILKSYLLSDGSLGDILILPAWGEKRFIRMKGNEVFKHAVRMMTETSKKVVADAGLTLDDIDYFIPHQANIRIISAVAEQLKLTKEKVVCNVDRYGNTSSASIPIALDEVWSQGCITSGKIVLLTGLGGGITAGSVIVRF
jgi:3-oxoacyl-[acyl-carrier-protein] synthase III